MTRSEQVIVAFSVAIVATCVVYVLQPSAPIYYPLERAWRLEPTRGVSMLWYGRTLVALAAGGASGFVASGLLRRDRKPTSDGSAQRLASLGSIAALATLVATLGYTVFHEWSKWVR